MSTDVDRMRALAAPGRKPRRGDAEQRIFNFSIDGHHFTAVKTGSAGTDPVHPIPSGPPLLGRSQHQRDIIGNIRGDSYQYVVFIDDEDVSHPGRPATDCLTSRELQISHLIADGKCDKEIARQLGISTYTVREHLRRIFSKLNVCRRSAVVSWVLRRHC